MKTHHIFAILLLVLLFSSTTPLLVYSLPQPELSPFALPQENEEPINTGLIRRASASDGGYTGESCMYGSTLSCIAPRKCLRLIDDVFAPCGRDDDCECYHTSGLQSCTSSAVCLQGDRCYSTVLQTLGTCLSCAHLRLLNYEWIDATPVDNGLSCIDRPMTKMTTPHFLEESSAGMSHVTQAETLKEVAADASPDVDGSVGGGSSGIRLSVAGFWVIVSLVILFVIGLVLRQIK